MYCPHCGRCLHCGHPAYSYFQPVYPFIPTWTVTGTVTDPTIIGNGFTISMPNATIMFGGPLNSTFEFSSHVPFSS